MQTILLLPALAVVCFGAAIPNPQEWESPTSLSGRPVPTYTIVVPCYPGAPDCVPKTLTYVGAKAAATAVAREAAPQELGSPSRTVLLPTPLPPVTTTKKPTSTTKKPTPPPVSPTKKSISTKKPTSTSKKHSTSTKKTHCKRQELGSPTRTVLLPTYDHPPPPLPTTTRKPLTSTKKTISTSKKHSTSTKKTHCKRQELGSPTRTVLLPTYPPPPPPPHATTKKPLTSTKKPTSTSKKYSGTTKKTHYRRQDLGSPTRTDLLPILTPTPTTTSKYPASTPKPPPHLPTYGGPWHGPGPIVTITVTYYPTSSRVTTTKAPTTSRYTSLETASTRTVSTTLEVPLDKRQSLESPSRTQLWPWPIPTLKTTTRYVTVTVTYTPYPPVSSTSYVFPSYTSRQPSSTLAITLHERQELGEPTRTDLLPIVSVSSFVTSTTKSCSVVPVTTLISTVKVTYPTTISVIKTTTEIVISTKTKTKTTCTEQPTTWDTFPTYPVTSRTTSYGNGPTTTRTIPTTLTVPYDKRQEIGGPIPSFTIPENISIPDASPIPTRTYGKRQELGSPSRSFTYIVPTTTGRAVTLVRDI